MWSNYHTHSAWCDGKSTIPEMVRQAEQLGMRSLGFASHGPLPFSCNWCMKPADLGSYCAQIRELDRQTEVELYAGLEVDFIPGEIGPQDFRDRLDYTVGSIHFVDAFGDTRWEADNTLGQFKEGLEKIFDNDIRKAVARYFQLMRQMLETSPPDILGHMDRIKMHNSKEFFFDEQEPWFLDEVAHTLEVAAQKRVMVEVNTRGLYKKRSLSSYPGPFGLKRLAELGIPVMLASDAHHVDDLTGLFTETIHDMKRAGIVKLVQLRAGQWTEESIDSFLS